ncbi:MAG: hypothetical protein WD080_10460 [Egibacteraceae bacterium]
MWAFASRQFRRWLIVAVGVPVAAWALDRLGEQLEARRGETTLSQAVRTTGAALHRRGRGPFAGRRGGAGGRPGDEGGLAARDTRRGNRGGDPGPIR